MKKRYRLRSVDEMHKADLRRAITYCERWANDPRVNKEKRDGMLRTSLGYRAELTVLENMPDSEYKD